ncbi:Transposase DDE domain-containing protein [Desulfacinum infernum DSM 9756]|uniref:Transposase DDE domain-containing protein n=1 Tax=Desulfacinum infernum DSM 9756 TaxID=1121391 RepID=A0A1M5IMM9_9BACT|nr:transposase [Desulfacinum infernum]SHG29495.1 Transposase DDE domain-containing protein [Desulfacinum infernum DSM 9756]
MSKYSDARHPRAILENLGLVQEGKLTIAGALLFARRPQRLFLWAQVRVGLFRGQRHLFTGLDLVFFDTTSIYFEGQGGSSLGQRGFSEDHGPDLHQMVVGAVLDGKGRPICCEMWPGNTTDVKTLLPVAERIRRRFQVARFCLVADRGMISRRTLQKLEDKNTGLAQL